MIDSMPSEQTQKVNQNVRPRMLRYPNWAFTVVLIVFLASFHAVLVDLFHKWYAQDLTGTYSHGLLVAVIVLYLLYKITLSHRNEFVYQPSVTGLVLLTGSQLALFAATLMEISFLQHILFVISLFVLVWSVYSYRTAKLYLLPAILFSLTFPVWGDLAQYLQQLSIFSTNLLLSLTGLPYYREQAFFHFPVGIIEIAPECAGLQQLLVSVIIGLLFSVQHRLRLFDLVKTLVYISILSILLNTIRILIIMAVGYFTKMESSLISQHILLGWVIYGLGIYLFLFLYSRKNFKTEDASDDSETHEIRQVPLNSWHVVFIPIVLVLVILPWATVAAVTARVNHAPLPPVKLAIKQADWHEEQNSWDINWRPAYPESDVVTRRVYRRDGIRIYAYVLTYSRLNAAAKPLNMVNTAYDPKHWKLLKQSLLSTTSPRDGQSQVRLDNLISANGERLAVLRYYRVNGHVVDSLLKAKLAILTGLLHFRYKIDVIYLATRMGQTGNGQQYLVDLYHALDLSE